MTERELKQKLKELNDAKKELDDVSAAFYNEIKINREKGEADLKKAINEEIKAKRDELPEEKKTLLLKMEDLELKKKGGGFYFLFFTAYMVLFTVVIMLFDISFSIISFWRYVIGVIVDLILSGITLSIVNSSKNKRIKEIREDIEIKRYMAERGALYRKQSEGLSEIKKLESESISKYNEQRDKDAENIDREIEKIKAQIAEIEKQKFIENNKNTLFIFGHNTFYEYEIFLNGMPYSEEPARKLIKIKINDELVNVRVISKHYETGDNHTYYLDFSRDCGVIQVESCNTPVFLMVDGFEIQQMNMNEFFYRIENKKFKD